MAPSPPRTREPTFGVDGEAAPENPFEANTAPLAALLLSLRRQQPTLGKKLLALFVRPKKG